MLAQATAFAASVRVAECRIDGTGDIDDDEADAWLNSGERKRRAAFVFAADGARFARARGFLRVQLADLLGCTPGAVQLEGGPGEKPFVRGAEFDFNLSHAGGLAVFAALEGGRVGIDLEIGTFADDLLPELDGLCRSCLTGTERDAILSAPAEMRARRFLHFWTAKEALMKLTGEGLARPPATISLALSGGMPVGYSRPCDGAAGLRYLRLSDPGAICCLAFSTDGVRQRPRPRLC